MGSPAGHLKNDRPEWRPAGSAPPWTNREFRNGPRGRGVLRPTGARRSEPCSREAHDGRADRDPVPRGAGFNAVRRRDRGHPGRDARQPRGGRRRRGPKSAPPVRRRPRPGRCSRSRPASHSDPDGHNRSVPPATGNTLERRPRRRRARQGGRPVRSTPVDGGADESAGSGGGTFWELPAGAMTVKLLYTFAGGNADGHVDDGDPEGRFRLVVDAAGRPVRHGEQHQPGGHRGRTTKSWSTSPPPVRRRPCPSGRSRARRAASSPSGADASGNTYALAPGTRQTVLVRPDAGQPPAVLAEFSYYGVTPYLGGSVNDGRGGRHHRRRANRRLHPTQRRRAGTVSPAEPGHDGRRGRRGRPGRGTRSGDVVRPSRWRPSPSGLLTATTVELIELPVGQSFSGRCWRRSTRGPPTRTRPS